MKSERTRDLQVNRVDNEKSNKIAIVQSLPNNGIEGDEIYRGVPQNRLIWAKGSINVSMGSGFSLVDSLNLFQRNPFQQHRV